MKKHSFAWRLCSYLLPFITLLFCITMAFYYHVSHYNIISKAITQASESINGMSLKINANLNSVSQTLESSAWLVEENIQNEEKLKEILKHNLEGNPFIIGGSIAFEPQVVNGKEHLKMLYVKRAHNRINCWQIKTEHYYYPGMDWYIIPKELKHKYWSEPYFDEGAGNIVMSTYSIPLINKNGEVYAVYTADISLYQFADMVKKIQPYEHSYSFMLSRAGYYLTHADKGKIMHETIFSFAFSIQNKFCEKLGHCMINGQKGVFSLDYNGQLTYAIYAPIPSTGWSICSVCQRSDILAGLNNVTRIIILIFIIGILLTFFFSILIIKELMKPLERFASSAKNITQENLEANLPEIKSTDEMKDLHDTFLYMQKSLVTSLSELKDTKEIKEKLQQQLNTAHQIQRGMLPQTSSTQFECPEVNLFATIKPSEDIAKDFIDFSILNQKLYFTIGSVSAKGISAALFTTLTKLLFRNEIGKSTSPDKIISLLNDKVAKMEDKDLFMNMFIGIFELKSGILQYCNAGNTPPAIISPDGIASLLDIGENPPIGLKRESTFTSKQIFLVPQTKICCYTEGLIEIGNANNQLYTPKKLLRTLSNKRQYGAEQIAANIIKTISEHSPSNEAEKDQSILIIHYKNQAS